MAEVTNRRALRWLRSELPKLASSGVISNEAAQAIDRHYEAAESKSTNFGFVLLASVGVALVGAGIILLFAHNWDELSRGTRTALALLPLVVAQILAVFVLMRRTESKAWRESVAIFDVAAVATAISLISQTYQIQGSFADFMMTWLLLSIPIVYLFRTTLGAVAYIAGTVAWLEAETSWLVKKPEELWFWILLLLIAPFYVMKFREDRTSRTTTALSILLAAAAGIGLIFVDDSAQSNFGAIAFAGLFTTAYLCGLRFFSNESDSRLPALALLGGLAIGVTAIVLSFEDLWHMASTATRVWPGTARSVGIAIQWLFPAIAMSLLASSFLHRRRSEFSIMAAFMPVVTILAWLVANQGSGNGPYSVAAAAIMNVYALFLGIELVARGMRVNSLTRANFGLLIVAALAVARFFDSDLSFVTRGLGFIVVGAGFLVANVILFRRQKRSVVV